MTDANAINNGLFGFINQIKVDIIAHQYPLIHPIQDMEGIRMTSLQDIGGMKLHAIVQNGTRYKDFIDMYFLLEHQSLQSLTEAYEAKYAPDSSISIAKNGLIYFNDIDYTVPIKLIKESLPEKTVHQRLKDCVIHPSKVYQPNILSEKKEQSSKRTDRRM
jgi:hypothetical protein